MNFLNFINLANNFISKFTSNEPTEQTETNNVFDLESQYMVYEDSDEYNESNESNQLNKPNEPNEPNEPYVDKIDKVKEINDLEIGCDGHNSIIWERSSVDLDYDVFYKGTHYFISHLDIMQIINYLKNKSCPIEHILKIYIENNFDIDMTKNQLTL